MEHLAQGGVFDHLPVHFVGDGLLGRVALLPVLQEAAAPGDIRGDQCGGTGIVEQLAHGGIPGDGQGQQPLGFKGQGQAAHQVPAGPAQLQGIGPGGGVPVVQGGLVVGEAAGGEVHGHGLGLAGGQIHLGEALELPHRPLVLTRGHIELDHGRAGGLAGIGDLGGDGDGLALGHPAGGQAGVGQGKVGIAQAVAEGEADLHLLLVIVAVAHPDALGVVHGVLVAGEVQVAGVVLQPQGPGLGQMAAGVGVAVEQGVGGLARALAAQVQAENGGHAVGPGQLHGAAAVEDHDGIGLHGGDPLDQLILALGQAHMAAVVALALEGVGQTGEDHRGLGLPGRRHRRVQILGGLIDEAGDIDRARRGQGQSAGDPGGVDMGGAAALVPGLLGVAAQVGQLLVPPQGQHAGILQQHGAAGLQPGGQLVLGLPVEDGLAHLGVPPVEDDGHHPGHGLVQHRLVQLSGADGLDQLLGGIGAGAGHLQLQPGLHGLDPAADRAPVAHHKAVKAPLVPENLGEKLPVLAGIDAVDPVIGAHHGPGLALLDRQLEGGQIDLMQGPLGHLGRDAHPAALLVVAGVVLHRRAHAPGLDAANQRRGQLTGQIGVLGEIFKIPAAEGAALDVDGRPQQYAHALGPAGFAQGLSHGLQLRGVEAAGAGAAGGVADRLNGVVDAQVVGLVILLPQTVGAVGDHHRRQAQPLQALEMPEVLAAAPGGLFLQRHL